MALYNLFDVIDTVSNIINDGIMYADISELGGNDEQPISLEFSAPDPEDPSCSIDYEGIDSLPDDYDISEDSISLDRIRYSLSFEELGTIHHALSNALEYFKECLADKSYPPETRDEIKSSSVACRNLQAKIGKFLKHF